MPGQTLTRGPYLQSGNSSSVIIRYATSSNCIGKVYYGTSISSLTDSVIGTSSVSDHHIKLNGLNSHTKYYYAMYAGNVLLQGNAQNYFITAYPVNTSNNAKILFTGDCGDNSTNQINVRDKVLQYLGGRHLDAWCLAGDNAYNSGYISEYDNYFFANYQDSLLKRFYLYPAPGNHDYANSSSRQSDHLIPYYDFFDLPTNAECGGQASGTEAFYSYNIGNIHLISLDSYGLENSGSTRLYDTSGAQVTWLKKDLDSNKMMWTVIYFHHPPYTKGSHNSDTETELVNMRQNLVRILDRYKVDLVVCGHSHSYERSYLINGHYGVENTFSKTAHAVDSSSALYNGSTNSCPYVKNTNNPLGTVYTVMGCSGRLGGTTSGYPHNAMYYSDVSSGGALMVEVENNHLVGKFICADGVIRDSFHFFKSVEINSTHTVNGGDSVLATATWAGKYTWSLGGNSKSKKIYVPAVLHDSVFFITVKDDKSCLKDTHFFHVFTPLPSKIFYWNYQVKNRNIHFHFSLNTIEVYNVQIIRKSNTLQSTKLVYNSPPNLFSADFSFIDFNPGFGNWNYEIWAIKKTGERQLISNINVDFGLENEKIFISNFNSSNQLQIWSTNNIKNAEIKILDLSGKVCMEQNMNLHAQSPFAVTFRKSGIYCVQVLQGKEIIFQKKVAISVL